MGNQGAKGRGVTGPHVHIEVREGKVRDSSLGAGAAQGTVAPTINPISYLYQSVTRAFGRQFLRSDVDQDGVVSIYDWVLVLQNWMQDDPQFDVNNDGIVNGLDLDEIFENWGKSKKPAASPIFVQNLFKEGTIGTSQLSFSEVVISRGTVQQWLDLARARDDGSITFRRGIVYLENLLATIIPPKTELFTNYPNPFNPETWIPYSLGKIRR